MMETETNFAPDYSPRRKAAVWGFIVCVCWLAVIGLCATAAGFIHLINHH